MTDVMVFDATDEGPDQGLVDFIRSKYWVIAIKGETCDAHGWLMSPGRPIDVVNGDMIWRRPTYREILIHLDKTRQGIVSSGHLMKFWSTDTEVLVCGCGHRQDSHRVPILGDWPVCCRSSCGCHNFHLDLDG